MKNIEEILSNINLNENSIDDNNHSMDNQTKEIVNKIFKAFAAIFPAFKQAWPTSDILAAAKEQYIKALIENNISDINHIKIGIKKARNCGSVFVLSPGQFIAWCKPTPEDYGLPGIEEAYKEACRNAHPSQTSKSWSHDAIKHAAIQTGYFELRTMPAAQTKPLFVRNYEISMRQFMDGEVSDIKKAIENRTEETKEIKRQQGIVLEEYRNVKSPSEAIAEMMRSLK
jgi:hypothetical protein